jgi:hypothetical protein
MDFETNFHCKPDENTDVRDWGGTCATLFFFAHSRSGLSFGYSGTVPGPALSSQPLLDASRRIIPVPVPLCDAIVCVGTVGRPVGSLHSRRRSECMSNS